MKRFLFALSVLCLSACHKKASLNHYRWSSKESQSKAQPKALLQSGVFATPNSTILLYDEIVEHYKQRVGGAIVDTSYLQKISSKQGSLQFLKAQFESDSFDKIQSQAEKLHDVRFAALEVMKRKHLALKNANHIFEPEVYLNGDASHPKFFFQFEYIPQNGNGIYSMRVSPSYAIESIKRVEKCFQESRSFVFPTGPRFSELIETFLTPLMGDGFLSNPRVNVSSINGSKVSAENGEFVFSPDDPRFDHVQAFFFAQKTLSYAESQWGFILPFPLKIELNAGYPEKSDLMYYHRRLIRLGDGNISYKNIPRDPSIVTHEIIHAIIDAISGMGSEGETAALNEGFADYLTASLWGIPELGHTAFLKRPFTRTVEIPTLYTEKNGGTYHDSGILSGTFWELEKQLGTSKTQQLALKTIARLGSQPHFIDIYPSVVDAAQSANFSDNEILLIKKIFIKRAWPVE